MGGLTSSGASFEKNERRMDAGQFYMESLRLGSLVLAMDPSLPYSNSFRWKTGGGLGGAGKDYFVQVRPHLWAPVVISKPLRS